MPWVFDVLTYDLGVHKIVGISYLRVMFMVHHIQGKGLGNFHYYAPSLDLSKRVSTNLNEDRMLKL